MGISPLPAGLSWALFVPGAFFGSTWSITWMLPQGKLLQHLPGTINQSWVCLFRNTTQGSGCLTPSVISAAPGFVWMLSRWKWGCCDPARPVKVELATTWLGVGPQAAVCKGLSLSQACVQMTLLKVRL